MYSELIYRDKGGVQVEGIVILRNVWKDGRDVMKVRKKN